MIASYPKLRAGCGPAQTAQFTIELFMASAQNAQGNLGGRTCGGGWQCSEGHSRMRGAIGRNLKLATIVDRNVCWPFHARRFLWPAQHSGATLAADGIDAAIPRRAGDPDRCRWIDTICARSPWIDLHIINGC